MVGVPFGEFCLITGFGWFWVIGLFRLFGVCCLPVFLFDCFVIANWSG